MNQLPQLGLTIDSGMHLPIQAECVDCCDLICQFDCRNGRIQINDKTAASVNSDGDRRTAL